MANVVFAPEADDDIFGIVEFTARDKPEAARNWMRKIRETCEAIATQPEMGEVRSGFGVPGCRSRCGQRKVFTTPPFTKRTTSELQGIVPKQWPVAKEPRCAEGPCVKCKPFDLI